jgi:hypothetical protein
MDPTEQAYLALSNTYRRRLQPGGPSQVLSARIDDPELDGIRFMRRRGHVR